jgi:hypothetical protein
MKQINDWQHFIQALGPFLAGSEPLERLRQSGAVPGGVIAEALERARPQQVLRADFLDRLQQSYGDVPPLRVQVASPRPEPPARDSTSFGLVVATDLAVLNEVVVALYQAGTIPREFDAITSAEIAGIDLLKQLSTGIPDDANAALLAISVPVLSAGVVSHRNLHVHIDWSLGFVPSAEPVSLLGSLELEIPLDLDVTASGVLSLGLGAAEPTGTLATRDGSPTVRLRSEQARQELEGKFVKAMQIVLLTRLREVLSVDASIPVQASRFPNSTINVVQAGAVTQRRSNRDFLIAGINVAFRPEPDIDALATQPLPEGANNIRATVSESFAADALSSVIDSGDLQALVGRMIDRHSSGLSIVHPQFEGGRVRFQDGSLRVALDCLCADACAFGKDLSFTATVDGSVIAVGGKLGIATSNVDFDLDNTDALLCSLLGALLGPFGLIITEGVLAFIAAFNPSAPDLDLQVSRMSEPLPGTDQIVDLRLRSASVVPGVLTADGTLQLISDPLRLYVHLQVVQGSGPAAIALPLAGATVELYELDNPAPAGDDVDIPDSGSTSHVTGNRFRTTRSISYSPGFDQLLGTATTDADGRATFISFVNGSGGTATVITNTQDLRTGKPSSSTITHQAVEEAWPDLAVTIRGATGHVLAERRLVALNLVGKRMGRFDDPVIISVPRDLPVARSPG